MTAFRRYGTRASRVVAPLVALAAFACTTSFPDPTATVSAPQLLAVQAVPAEVPPGGSFMTTALYVGPDGPADPSSLTWSTCLAPKPLDDSDPVAAACFADGGASLVSLGEGGAVAALMPSDACELFGPESPPPPAGQPAARPTDPDSTGGYYLPLSLRDGGGVWSAASERIACQPNGVTQSVFTAFTTQYVVNTNPVVASLSVVNADGTETPAATEPSLTVTAGSRVALRVAWAPCPSSPVACTGAETFLLVDPTNKQVVTSRESIVASWYATSGAFDLDRSGRDGTDLTTTADNGWTAPPATGLVHAWIVLRDARGGIGWTAYDFAIQ